MLPATVQVTLESVPAGLPLTLGSETQTAPFTRTIIRGSSVSLSAPVALTTGSTLNRFVSWSDGLAATHNTPPIDAATSFTAAYQTFDDVTVQGTPIALITSPAGGGNHNLDVIRDGVFPAVGSANSLEQYDTYTGDPSRSFDWIGYQFPAPRNLSGLIFQEGRQFFDGGWFTSLGVQVRTGGVWTNVPGMVSTPAYAGPNGVNYDQYALTFPSVTGDGIRIAGTPGGGAKFISVGELRVLDNGASQAPSTVSLIAPNGAESWVAGTVHAINWTSANVSVVNLDYRTSTGGPWISIAQNVPAASGTFSWTVPVAPTSQARVRVTDVINAATTDLSDTDFSITVPTGGGTSALYVSTDAVTKGSWKNVYGGQGFALANDGISYPSYAQVSLSGQQAWTWIGSTTALPALQKAVGTDRIAACWYTGASIFNIDVNITDGLAHKLTVYALDWDSAGRAETIDLLDAVSGTVLDSRPIADFSQGLYLTWQITGHVIVRITRTGPNSAALSGLFFDSAGGDRPTCRRR